MRQAGRSGALPRAGPSRPVPTLTPPSPGPARLPGCSRARPELRPQSSRLPRPDPNAAPSPGLARGFAFLLPLEAFLCVSVRVSGTLLGSSQRPSGVTAAGCKPAGRLCPPPSRPRPHRSGRQRLRGGGAHAHAGFLGLPPPHTHTHIAVPLQTC